MNSDEKHLPETQSSLLKQALDYEVNPIKLDNGKIFNPLKDATHRWISTQMSPPPFWGLTCEVLYLTHELKWILSVSDACFTQQGIWYSLHGQNSRHINDREAFEYFLDFQLCVPELLASRERELMKQVKEYYTITLLRTGEVGENRTGKYCRNATEWIVAARESDPIYCQLHEFSSWEYLELLGNCLIDLTRDVNRWPLDSSIILSEDSLQIVPMLIGKLTVDKRKWDWKCGRVPPESMDLLEIEWEPETRELQKSVRWIRSEFMNHLCCLEQAMHIGKREKPSAIAVRSSQCVLYAHRKEIEEVTLAINQAVEENHEHWILEQQKLDDQKQKLASVTSVDDFPSMSVQTPESRHAGDIDDEPAQPEFPTLRIVRNGFHFNGRFQELTPKPLQMLRLMTKVPGGVTTLVRAQDVVWNDSATEPGAVSRTVSKIRAAIRACLFLTEDVDPIPCTGKGDQAS